MPSIGGATTAPLWGSSGGAGGGGDSNGGSNVYRGDGGRRDYGDDGSGVGLLPAAPRTVPAKSVTFASESTGRGNGYRESDGSTRGDGVGLAASYLGRINSGMTAGYSIPSGLASPAAGANGGGGGGGIYISTLRQRGGGNYFGVGGASPRTPAFSATAGFTAASSLTPAGDTSTPVGSSNLGQRRPQTPYPTGRGEGGATTGKTGVPGGPAVPSARGDDVSARWAGVTIVGGRRQLGSEGGTPSSQSGTVASGAPIGADAGGKGEPVAAFSLYRQEPRRPRGFCSTFCSRMWGWMCGPAAVKASRR